MESYVLARYEIGTVLLWMTVRVCRSYYSKIRVRRKIKLTM